MAKKKKSSSMDVILGGTLPGAYKPPTKAEIIKSESKYIGQRIADADPKVKKVRDEISRAVEKAVKSALKGT